MKTIPKFTEATIRDRIDNRSFERGQQYFRENAIYNTRKQGLTLKGESEGSSGGPYNLQVTFDTKTITNADCSCPVGAGGRCKHVAALLLTWLAKPNEFLEIEELDTTLNRMTKEELIALVKTFLSHAPDLESLVETPVQTSSAKKGDPISPDVYRRKAASAMKHSNRGGGWYDDDESDYSENLAPILATGTRFLNQKDYLNALSVYEGVMDESLDHYEEYEDEYGGLGDTIDDCIEGLAACLKGLEGDLETRKHILQLLFTAYLADLNCGGYGFSNNVPPVLLELTTADEKRFVADLVREKIGAGAQSWKNQALGRLLLNLEAETMDDETYLTICRETGQIKNLITRLLKLNRLKDAAQTAAASSDNELPALVTLFVEHQHQQLADQLMEERAAKTNSFNILEWVRNRYLELNKLPEALEIAQRIFQHSPSREHFQQMRQIAQKLGIWLEVRAKWIEVVTQSRQSGLLIQMYLEDEDIENALVTLKRHQQSPTSNYSYGQIFNPHFLALEVAKAAEATHPREAIAIYKAEAEGFIIARNRKGYAASASYLKRVRDLYVELKKEGEWDAYITNLKEKNRSLRALKEELAAIGL